MRAVKHLTQSLRALLVMSLMLGTSLPAQANDYGWAMDNFYSPSFSNMLNGASQFAQAFSDWSAASACASDPQCGMPDDPSSGFELAAGTCCEANMQCSAAFDEHLYKVDRALYTLYKNERTYELIMKIQSARMTAMKGAGSMSAPAGAAVARMEVDIAKAQKSFIDKFNAKTHQNIDRLNEFLLGLGNTLVAHCGDDSWYQRSGLPVYLHAKTKFPK